MILSDFNKHPPFLHPNTSIFIKMHSPLLNGPLF